MKFDLVKDELSNLLEELMEQFHTIDSHEKAIPQIEMDIFMRNIQKLYENTIFLKKINESKDLRTASVKEEVQTIEKTEPVIEKIEEPTIEESKEFSVQAINEEGIKEDQEPNRANGEIEFKDHFDEQAVEETPQIIQQEAPQQNKIKAAIDEILEEENTDTDLFSNVKPSPEINDLNKKLADARSKHSIVEKLQNNRIENLKSVIGINDKFYFINELFGGDSQKYEDIIYTLNNFKKLEDAMQYFSTLKYRFTWDEESEPYAKLTHMLERKFNLIDA